jgi:hypothetical protein
MYPGDRVQFWVDGRDLDGNYLGQVSSNMPTGATNLINAAKIRVETQEDAAKTVWVSQWETFVGYTGMQPLGFLQR